MSGMYEAILADSRRDQSHAFTQGKDPELCSFCGGRRWRHAVDGFKTTLSPWPTPAQMRFNHRTNYKAHPGWTKPGTFRNKRENALTSLVA